MKLRHLIAGAILINTSIAQAAPVYLLVEGVITSGTSSGHSGGDYWNTDPTSKKFNMRMTLDSEKHLPGSGGQYGSTTGAGQETLVVQRPIYGADNAIVGYYSDFGGYRYYDDRPDFGASYSDPTVSHGWCGDASYGMTPDCQPVSLSLKVHDGQGDGDADTVAFSYSHSSGSGNTDYSFTLSDIAGDSITNSGYLFDWIAQPGDAGTANYSASSYYSRGGYSSSSNEKFTLSISHVQLSTTRPALTPEVPAPAAAWLFGSALAGLVLQAKRRKA